jgi:exopolyphosphatase/guanosine-5'-triphosphate,3'-diphosphate pyrophosphatase
MEWVRAFARKCRSNERHCEHVALLAQSIFDVLPDELRPSDSGREILLAAGVLHDIGYLISHTGHHKHAYHLIKHGDLPGFSASEIELIANVARYHRRALPKAKHENFARLDRDSQDMARRLAGILRVADGLDRAHLQSVRIARCEMKPDRVTLVVDAEANPQVEIWDAQRKAELFEKAFGRKLDFRWSKATRSVV